MQLPGVNASSDAYLTFAYHVQGACEAWVDAEIITAEQQKAVLEVGDLLKPPVEDLRAATNAADEAERLATMALARFRVRDVILDLRVMAVSDAVLNGPGLRDRQSPIFKQVFAGDNAGDITRARMRAARPLNPGIRPPPAPARSRGAPRSGAPGTAPVRRAAT